VRGDELDGRSDLFSFGKALCPWRRRNPVEGKTSDMTFDAIMIASRSRPR
jgi:hypothetical protein